MATIPQGSREYLTVPVRVLSEAGQAPTAVEVAVVGLADTPVELNWLDATWELDGARILLDFTMSKGRYSVWVRVTDNPECIIRRAGEIEIL